MNFPSAGLLAWTTRCVTTSACTQAFTIVVKCSSIRCCSVCKQNHLASQDCPDSHSRHICNCLFPKLENLSRSLYYMNTLVGGKVARPKFQYDPEKDLVEFCISCMEMMSAQGLKQILTRRSDGSFAKAEFQCLFYAAANNCCLCCCQ